MAGLEQRLAADAADHQARYDLATAGWDRTVKLWDLQPAE